jgi:hypothetical protein
MTRLTTCRFLGSSGSTTHTSSNRLTQRFAIERRLARTEPAPLSIRSDFGAVLETRLDAMEPQPPDSESL